MTSLVKIKQSLKSINMALLVLNMIGIAFSLLIGITVLFMANKLNLSPEDIATYEAQGLSISVEEFEAARQTIFSPVNLIMTIIPFILLLVVTLLLLNNQKRIQTDQPSPLPYYGGMGLIVFGIFSGIIQAQEIIPLMLGLNVFLFALYGTGFYLAKQFNNLK